jgi:LysM repeat protein
VLVLAAAGGVATAWIVANMRAVPPPVGDVPTPRPVPGQSFTPAPSDGLPTAQASEPPRRTPTPSPVLTVEPTPFIHIVERGESLTEIAELYEVAVEDIVGLNDIQNPNRIQVGQELLIPGYGTIPTPRPRR